MPNLLTVVQSSGLRTIEIPGWMGRTRPGLFRPKGVGCHHTGARTSNPLLYATNMTNGVTRPDLILVANLGLDEYGVVYVMADGRANHGGNVRTTAPAWLSRGATANEQLIGIEAMWHGASAWPPVMLDAYIRLCAALCVGYGWTAENVVGHKEWSTNGKPDPGQIDMAWFRQQVAAAMIHLVNGGIFIPPVVIPPLPPPLIPAPGGPVTYSVDAPTGEGWVKHAGEWSKADGSRWVQLAGAYPAPPPDLPPPPPEPPVSADWPAYPGPSAFGPGQVNDFILIMGQRLVELGFGGAYKVGPSRDWGEADRVNVAAYQTAHGWSGQGADGLPGPQTWQKLGERSRGSSAPPPPPPPAPAPSPPAALPASRKVYLDKLHYGQTDSDSVKWLQHALNGVSLPGGAELAITGNYFDDTDREVRLHQQHVQHATPDPVNASYVGPKQAALLFGPLGLEVIGSSSAPTPPAPAPTPPPPPASGATSIVVQTGRGVTYPYGVKNGRYAAGFHTGDDWAGPAGLSTRTTWSGTVVHAGLGGWGGAYGLHVIVESRSGIRTAYCHLSRVSVSRGQSVRSGDEVGKLGATGNVTGPHVHVEERTAPFGYNNRVKRPAY